MKILSSENLHQVRGAFLNANEAGTIVGGSILIGMSIAFVNHLVTGYRNSAPFDKAYSEGYKRGYQEASVEVITIEKSFGDGFQDGRMMELEHQRAQSRNNRSRDH